MDSLTITQALAKIRKKEFSISELVSYYISQIEKNKDLNAFITANEKALEKAKELDSNGDAGKKLFGIPIAVKDIFSTKDIRTTAASNILRDYIPEYESTVTRRILDEDAIIIGKTNLDSFCHGSSTATSDFGVVKNPYDKTKVPGGSSGGSAVAVASDLAIAALGTETAGSIRLPASWCGVVGLKPTYGRVSRYGVIAMGSSLDCPGPMTKSVEDSAYLLSIIAGEDANDFTSSNKPVTDYFGNLSKEQVKGLKIGVPNQFIKLNLQKGVLENFQSAIDKLKSLGAEIVYVDILDPKFSIATYTLTCRSEVSSNLARFDGTRYCTPGDSKLSASEYFENTRGKGFSQEPKRRIMTGAFALSAGYSDKYYKKSEQVRNLIAQDLDRILKEVDVIIGPSTPTTALTPEEALNNPLFGEMADVLAEGSSLAGLPGISIPNGLIDGLPLGLQIIGRRFDEQTILNVAYAYNG